MMRTHWTTTALLGALLLGTGAPTLAAVCGDINNNTVVDSIDSVGIATVVLGGGTPIGSHCGGLGTLDCGDLVDDNVINSQDLVASLQVAVGIDTLLTPCTGFGTTIACGTNVSGTITANQVWPGGCDTFVDGTVLVGNGAVVTVSAGARVKGRKSSTNGTPSALVVLRGSKINAAGTAGSPIVMTSDQAPGARGVGDWGGLSLLGAAPTNFPGGEGAAEGLPPGSANFGGSQPNDSSGQVRFTRIEFLGCRVQHRQRAERLHHERGRARDDHRPRAGQRRLRRLHRVVRRHGPQQVPRRECLPRRPLRLADRVHRRHAVRPRLPERVDRVGRRP
jgi:hypothetical protein